MLCEVAFSIKKKVSAKIGKECINPAYTESFYGYKGGEYMYDVVKVYDEEELKMKHSQMATKQPKQKIVVFICHKKIL